MQASIVTVEVDIPVKVQARLLGNGRRLISDIEEECGGVHIRFPTEKSESTKARNSYGVLEFSSYVAIYS